MEDLETLAPLDHLETDDLAFEFASDINEGETVSDAAVQVEVVKGRDPQPELLRVGAVSVNPIAGIAVQRIQGRFPDVTYKVRCRLTLSSGRVLVKAAYLPVVRR